MSTPAVLQVFGMTVDKSLRPPLCMQVKALLNLMHDAQKHAFCCATPTWQEAQLWDCALDPRVPYWLGRGSPILGSLYIGKKQAPTVGSPLD